ncbi:molybdopterin-dependent oxidoreductase [Natronomonas sp.]|uniref:molybdopterin-dependent oxidoreductase n=1 Tax=Natronomonas sp. TaxID=2184060 RepID=UPI002628E5FA|nr:molybdopterin-dependent oxidoreductase [Natronomonas sp.]
MAGVSGRLLRYAPPARAVDWSVLVCVSVATASGLYSFTVGSPAGLGWLPVWIHRVVGLVLLVLLVFKIARVHRRLTDPERWQRSTALSAVTGVVAAATLATGIVWGVVGLVWVAVWPLLAVHVGLGLSLVPLTLLHMWTRFRLPRRRDVTGRRTALKYFGLLAAGGIAARLGDGLTRVSGAPGADRRFTGSKPTGGSGNGSFPVTMWVADDPDPIRADEYDLSVTGLVADPRSYGYDDLVGDGPATSEEALLDCTSGWYTVEEWGGVRVGALLSAVGASEAATHVRFVSVTGYRWSLPIAEARGALLATHVGGETLTHGHGAPARLVAPGRRGFQWVKWVERIEVRDRGDPAQWVVTLVSGFE